MTNSLPDDKELVYIQACLGKLLFPDRASPLAPADLDWGKLTALLEEHRLAAYFYAQRSVFEPDWSKEFCFSLRKTSYMFSLYNDQRAIYVTQLLSALHASGVDIIVLKGWAFIQTIYAGDLSVRFCIDIDILIRPQDIPKAAGVLLQLDYQSADESWPGYAERYTNAQAYLSRNGSNLLQVGLHWGLINRPAYDPQQVDMQALFSRARVLNVSGVDVLELSIEDQIVYGCAHLALHHRYDPALYYYYETAVLIRQARSDLDWKTILFRAREWRCVLPLQRITASLEKLWPGLIPETVLEEIALLRPVFKERFVNWWIEKTRGRAAFDHPLYWITMPGLTRRFEVILKDTFPSPEYMRRRYGIAPAGLWPLLYFQRFFQALRLMKK